MSADTWLEELGVSDLGVSGLGEVDEPAFSGLAERHRRELHVHCYRMLGSFEDAEDTVQETFLRAWRRRETFEGRSTFRAWLYRIATNACLDLLAKVRPEPATGGEVLWLQPYPDQLLDELPAADADEPETVAFARETIELAYLVAVQHLAPRPRAVLILRDVLGWPAKDVAELLGDSVNSVNSALQRARAGMRSTCPPSGRTGPAATRTPGRASWYAALPTPAWPRTSTCSLPCCGTTSAARCRPRRPVRRPRRGGERLGRERLRGHERPARHPHLREPAACRRLLPMAGAGGRDLPLTLDVLRVTGGAITEIITFHNNQFPRLGLPERLPANGGGKP